MYTSVSGEPGTSTSSEVPSPPTDPNPQVRIASEIALDEIEEVITKALEKFCHIRNIVKKNNENDEYTKELFAYYISLVGSRNTNLMDGEWLERKIFYIANLCRKTELDCLVTVIKEALRDMYPNIPIFPTVQKELFEECEVSSEQKIDEELEKSKFAKIEGELQKEKEKYKIKSKNIETDGETKRYFLCLFPGCEKGFCSYRTADACLNKHLKIMYKCLTCEFVTHNLNSSHNHKCFAYSSACKRHGSGGKCKSGETPEKKVKLEFPEADIIVIDD